MRISEAKQCIKEVYANTGEVTALISERGVGKTSAYRQCADELEIGYMALYAAALEGPDFMGLPDKNRETGVTHYLAPQFMPTRAAVEAGLFPERGLLVIEEINRVPSDTVSVLYPLLLEGRINTHELVPGWKIGVTMNPDTLNYAVNALDDALIDRFISIEISADLDDYIAYSHRIGAFDAVLAFLSANPDMLLVTREAADSDPLAKSPTPRGWTKVQKVLESCVVETPLAEQLVAGIVGPEGAASLFGYLATYSTRIPGARETLENFESQRATFAELLRGDRFDVLHVILKKISLQLQLNPLHLKNADKLLDFLPQEFAVLFFKYLATRRAEDFDSIAGGLTVFDRVADDIVEFIAT